MLLINSITIGSADIALTYISSTNQTTYLPIKRNKGNDDNNNFVFTSPFFMCTHEMKRERKRERTRNTNEIQKKNCNYIIIVSEGQSQLKNVNKINELSSSEISKAYVQLFKCV